MPESENESPVPESFFATPWAGTLFTVMSGLSFMLVCMVLPLVGKAGMKTTYAAQNQRAFLVIVLVSLVLAALATFSKLARRKIDSSPLPLFSMILMALCILLLVALTFGLLHI